MRAQRRRRRSSSSSVFSAGTARCCRRLLLLSILLCCCSLLLLVPRAALAQSGAAGRAEALPAGSLPSAVVAGADSAPPRQSPATGYVPKRGTLRGTGRVRSATDKLEPFHARVYRVETALPPLGSTGGSRNSSSKLSSPDADPDVYVRVEPFGSGAATPSVGLFCDPAWDDTGADPENFPQPGQNVWKAEAFGGESRLTISRNDRNYRPPRGAVGGYVPAFLCAVVNLDATGPVSYRFEAALAPANVSLAPRQQAAVRAVFEACCPDSSASSSSAASKAGGGGPGSPPLACNAWRRLNAAAGGVVTDFCGVTGQVCDADGNLLRLDLRRWGLRCAVPGDALAAFPKLQSLNVAGNPGLSGSLDELFGALARVPSMRVLNAYRCTGLGGSLLAPSASSTSSSSPSSSSPSSSSPSSPSTAAPVGFGGGGASDGGGATIGGSGRSGGRSMVEEGGGKAPPSSLESPAEVVGGGLGFGPGGGGNKSSGGNGSAGSTGNRRRSLLSGRSLSQVVIEDEQPQPAPRTAGPSTPSSPSRPPTPSTPADVVGGGLGFGSGTSTSVPPPVVVAPRPRAEKAATAAAAAAAAAEESAPAASPVAAAPATADVFVPAKAPPARAPAPAPRPPFFAPAPFASAPPPPPASPSSSASSASDKRAVCRLVYNGLVSLEITGVGATGTLPSCLTGPGSALVELHVGDNRLAGGLPSVDARSPLEALTAYSNAFTGSIPASLLAAPALRLLDVADNKLAGTISAPKGAAPAAGTAAAAGTARKPSAAAVASLKYFVARGNRLTGAIPSSLATAPNLQTLDVRNNSLSGPLPKEWVDGWPGAENSSLVNVRFSLNKISGAFPAALGRVPGLTFLTANQNALSGELPDEPGMFPAIRGFNASNNGLTGGIGEAWGSTGLFKLAPLGFSDGTRFTPVFDVSNNDLSGPVPAFFTGDSTSKETPVPVGGLDVFLEGNAGLRADCPAPPPPAGGGGVAAAFGGAFGFGSPLGVSVDLCGGARGGGGAQRPPPRKQAAAAPAAAPVVAPPVAKKAQVAAETPPPEAKDPAAEQQQQQKRPPATARDPSLAAASAGGGVGLAASASSMPPALVAGIIAVATIAAVATAGLVGMAVSRRRAAAAKPAFQSGGGGGGFSNGGAPPPPAGGGSPSILPTFGGGRGRFERFEDADVGVEMAPTRPVAAQ